MEKFKLDKLLYQRVLQIISDYTKQCSKDKNIYGLYMIPFKDEIHNVVSLNSITNTKIDQLIYYTLAFDEIEVTYHEKNFNNYNKGMFTKESINACKDLANSIILYDKTGELTELQNSLKEDKNFNYKYNNLIEFEPPLQLKKVYRVPVKKIKR